MKKIVTFLLLMCLSLLNAQEKDSIVPIENYLNEVVITGTKTFKRKTNSPVLVTVLDKISTGFACRN